MFVVPTPCVGRGVARRRPACTRPVSRHNTARRRDDQISAFPLGSAALAAPRQKRHAVQKRAVLVPRHLADRPTGRPCLGWLADWLATRSTGPRSTRPGYSAAPVVASPPPAPVTSVMMPDPTTLTRLTRTACLYSLLPTPQGPPRPPRCVPPSPDGLSRRRGHDENNTDARIVCGW